MNQMGGLNFMHLLIFWNWIKECLIQFSYVQKKRLMTSFRLNIGQKLVKFWKVTSTNLKIGNTSRKLNNFKYLGVVFE